MNKPAMAFFGTPELAAQVLESLLAVADVRLVVTQPAKPVGKGRQLQKSAVHQLAEEHGLKVFTPVSFKDPMTREQLLSVPVELAVVAAYGKILPRWSLEWPARGMVNVHASLLPEYRGASPIQGALLAGEQVTGITFMQMNERMDEGDVLRQHDVVIAEDETAESLTGKLARIAAANLPQFLTDYLEGLVKPVPQDDGQATYTKILNKEDGLVDFQQPPTDLERRIRSFYPWPGVWGWYQDKRVKLLPGGLVQMEGKKPVSLADFRRGYPDFPLRDVDG